MDCDNCKTSLPEGSLYCVDCVAKALSDICQDPLANLTQGGDTVYQTVGTIQPGGVSIGTQKIFHFHGRILGDIHEARALRDKGANQYVDGAYDDAKESLIHAYKIHCDNLEIGKGTDYLEFADCLMCLGRVQQVLIECDQALATLNKALCIYQAIASTNHRFEVDVARNLERLVEICDCNGNKIKAQEYRHALEGHRKQWPDDNCLL